MSWAAYSYSEPPGERPLLAPEVLAVALAVVSAPRRAPLAAATPPADGRTTERTQKADAGRHECHESLIHEGGVQANGLGMIPLPKTREAPHKGRPYEPVCLLVVVLVDRVESLLDLLVGPRLVGLATPRHGHRTAKFIAIDWRERVRFHLGVGYGLCDGSNRRF